MNLEGLQTSVIFFDSQGSSVTHVPTFQDLSDFFFTRTLALEMGSISMSVRHLSEQTGPSNKSRILRMNHRKIDFDQWLYWITSYTNCLWWKREGPTPFVCDSFMRKFWRWENLEDSMCRHCRPQATRCHWWQFNQTWGSAVHWSL